MSADNIFVRRLQLSRDLQKAVNQAVEDGSDPDLVHEAIRALCNLDDQFDQEKDKHRLG